MTNRNCHADLQHGIGNLLELHVERRIHLESRLTKPFVEHGELRLDEDVEDRAAHRYHLPDAEAERDVVGAVL